MANLRIFAIITAASPAVAAIIPQDWAEVSWSWWVTWATWVGCIILSSRFVIFCRLSTFYTYKRLWDVLAPSFHQKSIQTWFEPKGPWLKVRAQWASRLLCIIQFHCLQLTLGISMRLQFEKGGCPEPPNGRMSQSPKTNPYLSPSWFVRVEVDEQIIWIRLRVRQHRDWEIEKR